MTPMSAEELKLKGNECYKCDDFANAEIWYSKAIIKDSMNAALFTNRALVRLKLNKYEDVISDCLKAIDLAPTSMKAYTNLGKAQLALGHPNEALTSSLTAYRLAITQRSTSAASIAVTCLEAKKKRWEKMELRRIEKESLVLREMVDIIEKDADRQVNKIICKATNGCLGELTVQELEEEIRQEARERIKTLEDVFGKAEAERLRRRTVPDYLIDNISFQIMLDPVITKNGRSYDRATLLGHLRNSQTDPLTREPLTEQDLVPNYALKEASDQFLTENGWAVDW